MYNRVHLFCDTKCFKRHQEYPYDGQDPYGFAWASYTEHPQDFSALPESPLQW